MRIVVCGEVSGYGGRGIESRRDGVLVAEHNSGLGQVLAV